MAREPDRREGPERYPPRGVDYELNWSDEGRNDYGDRDYYGNRAGGARRHPRGPHATDIDYNFGNLSEYAIDYEGRGDIGRLTEGGVDHRGRGPRGYRRSDERILEDVCDALTDDPDIDASSVEVGVKDREVTLSGTVDSRTTKRRAEDIAERIAGVRDVHNGLRIATETRASGA